MKTQYYSKKKGRPEPKTSSPIETLEMRSRLSRLSQSPQISEEIHPDAQPQSPETARNGWSANLIGYLNHGQIIR